MTVKEIIDGLKFTIDMFLFNPGTGETFIEPRNDMDKTTIDACKGAIELLEQMRWIPVSVKLPEKGRQVLCCNKHGSVFTSAVTYIKEDEYGHKFAYFGEHYEVVAWMPLPEPYKAESEDKE